MIADSPLRGRGQLQPSGAGGYDGRMNEETPNAVATISLGCPKNLVDSERMLADLAEGGCIVGAELDEANVVLINTCGFLDEARDEALAVIEEVARLKRAGRIERIVVAGCLPQREGEGLLSVAPDIDAIVGVNDRSAVLQAVRGEGPTSRLSAYVPGTRPLGDAGRFRLTADHTAYLRIAEGCSRECSFCTIPAIRGPFRSKHADDVLAEAAELTADGAKELNLIAQDTTAWGGDLGPADTLASLLRRLDSESGAEWLRLMYTYPMRFTDDLIGAMAECSRVVPYVDMPLQHIADGVLQRMRRGATGSSIRDLLDRVRRRVENIAIRTTFIVGFPGETDEEFAELLDFVKDQRFEAMGVFAFSPENGTPAAEMDGQLPEDVKAERLEALMLAQQEIAFAANEAAIGGERMVLVDGVNEEGICIGRHAGQAPEVDSVCLLAEPRDAGEMVSARIAGADGYDLIVQPM